MKGQNIFQYKMFEIKNKYLNIVNTRQAPMLDKMDTNNT